MNPTILAQRLAEFNAQMNAAESAMQKILFGKKIAATEKQMFEAACEIEERAMEEALKNHVSASPYDKILSTDEYLKALKEQASDETIPFPESFGEDAGTVVEIQEEISNEVLKKEGKFESFSLNITLNAKQEIAGEMAEAGKSYCLIGPAGSGKTTAQRVVAEKLLKQNRLGFSRFKTYGPDEKPVFLTGPSIAFVAFTRRAAANLRKALFKSPFLERELKNNVMTVHALLEYIPETYIGVNDAGEEVEKFRFAPQRHAGNPLNITHLVIEESSMLDAYNLWRKLYDALPEGVQIVFIGDINQLPPVFGPSILNYALLQLPIVELTEVYRNQGIVLENAHHVLKGEPLEENQDFVIVRGKSKTPQGQERVAIALGNLFDRWMDITGNDGLPEYSPDDCIILSPWNKQPLGTDNLNNWIAQHAGKRRDAIVYEVIAGFAKLYLAVGDRVMVNRMDGIIVSIHINASYHGKQPQIHGKDLTRFGQRILGENDSSFLDELGSGLDYTTFSLEELENQKEARKQQASHIVTVLLDNGQTEVLSGAGEFSDQNFSLGYALTVHKAQGSEWRKVFIILHKDHAVSLYRELFYTALTRARTKVTIIASDTTIEKAIKNQRIKGKTIADKIEYFNSGVMGKDDGQGEIYATK
jgi:energy-coupling factor transporter ATP-binding protein EcfA2